MTQSAVIVTGAASGIGYACAHNVLTDGVPVVATDIGEIPEALVNAGDRLPLSFYVSAEQSCQEAVASATARFGGDGRGGPAYISSKAAIRGLTRSLARSLGKYGIRVNAVSPGTTETPNDRHLR